ncbi:MAG TPA: antitoxin family protein [Kofleriaceae bacterium]|nr:antitoxin family protein [Kofleriaceae bacterium]
MASIEADYVDGVLRPTKPLSLRDGERVRLLLVRQSDPSRWKLDCLADGADEDRALAEAGLGAWADALDALDAP